MSERQEEQGGGRVAGLEGRRRRRGRGGDRARIDTNTVARFGSPVHRLLCLNISGAGFMDRD